MAVKPQVHTKIDLGDERVKSFLRGGAPVLEDVVEEERKREEKRKQEEKLRLEEENRKKEEESKWTMMSMRIPVKLLKAIDEKAGQRYMNRSAWLMEMIQEKLKEGNQ